MKTLTLNSCIGRPSEVEIHGDKGLIDKAVVGCGNETVAKAGFMALYEAAGIGVTSTVTAIPVTRAGSMLLSRFSGTTVMNPDDVFKLVSADMSRPTPHIVLKLRDGVPTMVLRRFRPTANLSGASEQRQTHVAVPPPPPPPPEPAAEIFGFADFVRMGEE